MFSIRIFIVWLLGELTLISVINCQQIDSSSDTKNQLYMYDFIENTGPIQDQQTTTTESPTTTTELTTTTINNLQTDGDGTNSLSGGRQPSYPGSDEVKVIFRDCKPYKNDCLFGGPICASDTKTYPNFMFMECINYRRALQDRVKVVHEGPCWSNPGGGFCPMDPVYDPLCGTDNETYSNKRALECEIKKPGKQDLRIKYKGECIGNGFCFFANYTWEKPVCVSSGRTLQSYQAVRCLRSLDSGVEILHDGPCTGTDLKRTLKDRLKICHRMRQEIEPFPVCANDNQSYPSAAYVICNKPHLEIEFDRTCGSEEHTACTTAKKMDQESKCEAVCGSDGKNYNSKHHLKCAQIIKSYLSILHEGPCEALDSPCVRLYQSNDNQEAVCATDGVTYISPLALECVSKYKRNGVIFKHMGPCLKNY